MADMELDMVADMEVDKVAGGKNGRHGVGHGGQGEKMADMELDMVANMEVDRWPTWCRSCLM